MILPKTVGTCVDKLYELDVKMAALRKESEAKSDKLKKQYLELHAHTLGLMNQQKSSEAAGRLARIKRTRKVSPVVEDFSKFFNYVISKGDDAMDLVAKSCSSPAVRLRWEAGEQIPGVGKYDRFELGKPTKIR